MERLRLLSTRACRGCPGNAELIEAAQNSGCVVSVVPCLSETVETQKAAKLGFGLPVLVRRDGAMSVDAKTWKGAPRAAKRKKETSDVSDLLGA